MYNTYESIYFIVIYRTPPPHRCYPTATRRPWLTSPTLAVPSPSLAWPLPLLPTQCSGKTSEFTWPTWTLHNVNLSRKNPTTVPHGKVKLPIEYIFLKNSQWHIPMWQQSIIIPTFLQGPSWPKEETIRVKCDCPWYYPSLFVWSNYLNQSLLPY